MIRQTAIAIIGAGAAGLAAAISASEAAGDGSGIVLVEGSRHPGAKILACGGGRCNVTNEHVDASDYHGGPRHLIAHVLRAFGSEDAVEWMQQLGVVLKLEDGGKYFPASGQARTVLDALLRRVQRNKVHVWTGQRVAGVDAVGGGFRIRFADPSAALLECRRVIACTGGLAMPRSGSDGAGLDWMRSLGHSIVPTTPALVPLVVRKGHTPGGRIHSLAGVSAEMRVRFVAASGKVLAETCGSVLFTHFGLSGPAVLDISRHVLCWRREHRAEVALMQLGHPEFPSVEAADAWLRAQAQRFSKRTATTVVAALYPQRLAELLCGGYGRMSELARADRIELAKHLAGLTAEVTGDRGYAEAECTAGGVDLHEVSMATMESKMVKGLHLAGEILDADGRIGGYNFQWAWATGYLAGTAVAAG